MDERLTSIQDMIKQYTYTGDEHFVNPNTKPKKRKVVNPQDLGNITIVPVNNGYILQSTDVKGETFVFPDIDSAFTFMRSALKPTREQKEVLESI